MDVKQDDLGYLRFFNTEDGTEVFSITPAVMKDSNVDPGSGDSAVSFDVSMELSSDKGGSSTLTFTADPAWLADPARVYPVYIDPSMNIYPRYSMDENDPIKIGDAYASSAYPGTNFGHDWDPNYGFYQLKSGYYNSGTGHNRSAIGFDVRKIFHKSTKRPGRLPLQLRGKHHQFRLLCLLLPFVLPFHPHPDLALLRNHRLG